MVAVRCGDCSFLKLLDCKLNCTGSDTAVGTNGVLIDLGGSEMR